MKTGKTSPASRKKTYFVLVISILFLIISISFSSYLILSKPIETRLIQVEFNVGSNIGFDINSTALKFGKVPKGASATRTLNVMNNHDFPIEVNLAADKNISDLISVDKNYVILPGQYAQIQVTLTIPKEYVNGEHTGVIILEINKK